MYRRISWSLAYIYTSYNYTNIVFNLNTEIQPGCYTTIKNQLDT